MTVVSDFASVNHPVHIIDKNGQQTPSALIPFCEFGGNMSIMGVNIDYFDIPVCTSFEATVLNDQLCYEVDLNRFSNKDNIDRELKLGFNFIMDYNEDRQVTFNKYMTTNKVDQKQDIPLFEESKNTDHASIYLNTIG